MRKLFMLAVMVAATSSAFAQDVKSASSRKTMLRQSLSSELASLH